jgi:hypothetical protein
LSGSRTWRFIESFSRNHFLTIRSGFSSCNSSPKKMPGEPQKLKYAVSVINRARSKWNLSLVKINGARDAPAKTAEQLSFV